MIFVKWSSSICHHHQDNYTWSSSLINYHYRDHLHYIITGKLSISRLLTWSLSPIYHHTITEIFTILDTIIITTNNNITITASWQHHSNGNDHELHVLIKTVTSLWLRQSATCSESLTMVIKTNMNTVTVIATNDKMDVVFSHSTMRLWTSVFAYDNYRWLLTRNKVFMS